MDLLNRDALELSALLEAREVSAEELMRETLKQIDQLDSKINSIVSLRDRDILIGEARKADHTPRRGWLHGLPLAVKDLAHVAGLTTSMGSPIFEDTVAKEDSVFVARMRRAGALFIGKTNTPEFGLGCHTYNDVHGHTHNPYDLTKSPGGSSGGAAAAVASRLLPVADGSDMMGSLRNPAGWCNIYGFRPTWGRVPGDADGDMFLHQVSTNGAMGRSPADVAALLEVQAGWDHSQPHGFLPEIYLDRMMGDLAFARIGWLGDWGGAYPMADGILDSSLEAMKTFERLGSIVEEVDAPFPAEQLWAAWTTLRAWNFASKYAHLLESHRDLMKPEAIWEIELGLSLSAMDVHSASVVRSQWFRKAASMFEDYDLLVLPSAQVWPFSIELRYPQSISGKVMDTYHRWMEVAVPVSLSGLPCLSVPGGFGTNGLPFGLQFIGPARGDLRVLQLGQAWHEGTNWPSKKPPLVS